MKSFLTFMSEDIDLFADTNSMPSMLSGTNDFTEYHNDLAKSAYSNTKVNWIKKKFLPGYDLYHYKIHRLTSDTEAKHVIVVVHVSSNTVAAELRGRGVGLNVQTQKSKSGGVSADIRDKRLGKTIQITSVEVNSLFRKARTGASIAQALYKKLSADGYTLVSDSLQTLGGASLWQSLRKDPDTINKMDLYDPNRKSIESAKHKEDEEIWSTTDPNVMRNMKKVKANIPPYTSENPIGDRRLVLRGSKRK